MGDLRDHAPVCDECGRRHPPLEYCYQYASHNPDPEWSARQIPQPKVPAMTGVVDPRPANCRFRLQAEGKPYPRSSCTACGRNISTLGTQCLNIKVPAMLPHNPIVEPAPKYGFSDEEQAAILNRPEILADFLRYSQKHGFEKAVEHVRLAYFEEVPPVLAAIRDMVDAYRDVDRLTPSPDEVVRLLVTAGSELEDTVRKPLWRLREGLHSAGPHRWVLLWGPSGYKGVDWRCHVGRLSPPDHKFAGKYVRHDGECFTDDGPDATHFSELP